MGVINMKLSGRTGRVVSIRSVVPGEELVLMTRNGVVNRQNADDIRLIGRATQGVILVALDEGDAIVDVARVVQEEEVEGEVVDGDAADGTDADGGATVAVDGDTAPDDE